MKISKDLSLQLEKLEPNAGVRLIMLKMRKSRKESEKIYRLWRDHYFGRSIKKVERCETVSSEKKATDNKEKSIMPESKEPKNIIQNKQQKNKPKKPRSTRIDSSSLYDYMKEEISAVMKELGISWFPTVAEINKVTGSYKVTGRMYKTGGMSYWAKELKIPLEKRVGHRRFTGNEKWVLYKGNQKVCTGTMAEIAKKTGTTVSAVYEYSKPAHFRKIEKRGYYLSAKILLPLGMENPYKNKINIRGACIARDNCSFEFSKADSSCLLEFNINTKFNYEIIDDIVKVKRQNVSLSIPKKDFENQFVAINGGKI